jgi:aryl-alcohol dehydrogenase-like predicted oxidoreductase
MLLGSNTHLHECEDAMKIQHRHLGRTGLKVSPLCLGTMLYGQSVARAESIDMIDRAISSGINFIDMANVYGDGETEEIVGAALRKRQEGLEEEVKAIAWKAQHRLHRRYRQLTARGKVKQQAVTAVGRELLGFIWAIGVHVESQHEGLQANRKRAA